MKSILIVLAFAAVTYAHMVLTYPGTRGNNLITNDTYPYGMQWMYPCGGMGTSRNRTYWPTTGGAVGYQPGWFRGHLTALTQINLGFGTDGPDHGPPNMSNPMVPPFQILGPTNNPYPGSICLPQVPLPKNASVKAGDLATIQVVETAQHGAALYACVDIIFAEPGDPRIQEVNSSNCENSTWLGFANMYTVAFKDAAMGPNSQATSSKNDATAMVGQIGGLAGWLPLIMTAVMAAF